MTSSPDGSPNLDGLVLLTRRKSEGGLEVRANGDPDLLDLKWRGLEASLWRPDFHPMPYSRGLAIAVAADTFIFSRYHYGFRDGFGRPAASEAHIRLARMPVLMMSARRLLQALDKALHADSRFEGHAASLSTCARSRVLARRLDGSAFSRWLQDACTGKRIVLKAGRRPELVSELLTDWLLARLPHLLPGVYSSINFSFREALRLQALPTFSKDHADGVGIEAFFQGRRRCFSNHCIPRQQHRIPSAAARDRILPGVSSPGVSSAES